MNVRPPKARPTRVRRRQPSRRQLTTILWEKLEARWVLTGPYVNAQLSQNDMDTLVTGLDGLSAYGRRLGDSGYYAEPLKGIRHQDGSPVTIGAGNPLGRPVEEGVANPLRDYYAVSQPTDWDTDALLLQWDGDDAPQQLIPEYKRDAGPRLAAGEVTGFVGYATEPELAASYFGTYLAWIDDSTLGGDGDTSLYILSRDRDVNATDYVLTELESLDASGRGLSTTGRSAQSLSLGLDQVGFASTSPYAVWTEAAAPTDSTASQSAERSIYLRVNQDGLTLVDDQAQMTKFGFRNLNVLNNDLNLFGELEARVVEFDGRPVEEGQSLQFTSNLGAQVIVLSNGEVTYDPRGVAAFRRLRRGESLQESFVYQVDNFIHQAEAKVTFVVNGVNAWNNLRNVLDVNDDGFITALDALLIINELNTVGARSLIESEMVGLQRFIDVNDDGFVTALDALLLINWLNGGR